MSVLWDPSIWKNVVAAIGGIACGVSGRWCYRELRLHLMYRHRLHRSILLYGRKETGVPWEIHARPVGRNRDNKNEGGLVIELRSSPGGSAEEIARVAFERSNSLHPDVPYAEQVDIEVEKAVKTLEAIRELQSEAGALQ